MKTLCLNSIFGGIRGKARALACAIILCSPIMLFPPAPVAAFAPSEVYMYLQSTTYDSPTYSSTGCGLVHMRYIFKNSSATQTYNYYSFYFDTSKQIIDSVYVAKNDLSFLSTDSPPSTISYTSTLSYLTISPNVSTSPAQNAAMTIAPGQDVEVSLNYYNATCPNKITGTTTNFAKNQNIYSYASNQTGNYAGQIESQYRTAGDQLVFNPTTTVSGPPLPTITTTAADKQVTINASDPQTVQKYWYFRKNSVSSPVPFLDDVVATTIDTGLTNGRTYYYNLSAVTANGVSALTVDQAAATATRNFGTTGPTPVPQDITPRDIKIAGLILSVFTAIKIIGLFRWKEVA